MKKLTSAFCFIIFFITLTNINAEEIKIISDPPEAEVSIREFGSTKKQKLGKTPYTTNIQDLANNYSSSQFFMIIVEKENFQTQSIALSSVLKSDISLTINLEPIQDYLKYKEIDKSISELFEAQRLARAQQYENALELLKKIDSSEKNLSTVPELMGAIYYLKKDLKTSLAYYNKAFRINPENKDAYQMKAYLEKTLGVEKNEN